MTLKTNQICDLLYEAINLKDSNSIQFKLMTFKFANRINIL